MRAAERGFLCYHRIHLYFISSIALSFGLAADAAFSLSVPVGFTGLRMQRPVRFYMLPSAALRNFSCRARAVFVIY